MHLNWVVAKPTPMWLKWPRNMDTIKRKIKPKIKLYIMFNKARPHVGWLIQASRRSQCCISCAKRV